MLHFHRLVRSLCPSPLDFPISNSAVGDRWYTKLQQRSCTILVMRIRKVTCFDFRPSAICPLLHTELKHLWLTKTTFVNAIFFAVSWCRKLNQLFPYALLCYPKPRGQANPPYRPLSGCSFDFRLVWPPLNHLPQYNRNRIGNLKEGWW